MSEDDDLLEELVVEANEHLDLIEPILAGWADDMDSITTESVNQSFRSLHTIKGGFGFFSMHNIKELSHAMESLLMQVRDEGKILSEEMITTLIDGTDILRGMIEDVGSSDEEDISEIVSALKQYLGQEGGTDSAEADGVSAISAANNTDAFSLLEPSPEQWAQANSFAQGIFYIILKTNTDLKEKNRTPLDIDHALSSLGEVIGSKLDFSGVEGLSNCLDSEMEYHLLYQSMAPAELIAMELDVGEEQIKQLEEDADENAAVELDTAVSQEGVAAVGEIAKPVAKKAVAKKAEAKKKDVGKEKGNEALRIPLRVIDSLVNQAGELVLNRNQMRMVLGQRLNQSQLGERVRQGFAEQLEKFQQALSQRGIEASDILDDFRLHFESSLSFSLDDIPDVRALIKESDGVTNDMQDTILQTRLQPVGSLFNKTPRLVRSIAKDLGKQIHLEITGQDTEMDKTVIEALSDPLTHLLRNSCDHGVETPEKRLAAGKDPKGRVELDARHESGMVVITITDDGGGISRDRVLQKALDNEIIKEEDIEALTDSQILSLIFKPGFSTAAVVSDVSGRGVGMDVVRTNIEKIGGSVDVESEEGMGSIFTMRIPLTLAIVPALMVRSGGLDYALPQTYINELLRIRKSEFSESVEHIGDADFVRLRGKLLPLIYLERLLDSPVEHDVRSYNVAVVNAEGMRIGVVLGEISDSVEIVVKPLNEVMSPLPAYSGATILGNGNVALILDPSGLARMANLSSDDRQSENEEVEDEETTDDSVDIALLEAPDGGRMSVPLKLVTRLDKLTNFPIDDVGGLSISRYQGDIVPICWVHELLPERRIDERAIQFNREDEENFVAMIKHDGKPLGLAIHRIVDIGSHKVEAERPRSRDGIDSCLVIQDRVTEMLDVSRLVQLAGLQGVFTGDVETYSEDKSIEQAAIAANEAKKTDLTTEEGES